MPLWAPYVPVAQRRFNALREMTRLRKKGRDIQPVEIEGRTIARSFWGKGWCDHLESFSDFANRLPRGRTYVRNGSVCHLAVQPGRIEAIVSGSDLYRITIRIKKLKPAIWRSVKEKCAGRIGSMLELLRGRLSDQVMMVVTDRTHGLFPQPGEIQLGCDCPDWAVMCKHAAAALYGVGSRLDSRPELLFILRDVDANELISTEMTVPDAVTAGDTLDDDQLGDIFGIDLDVAGDEQPAAKTAPKTGPKKGRRAGRRTASRAGRERPGRAARAKSVPAATPSKVSQKGERRIVARPKPVRAKTAVPTRAGGSGGGGPRLRPTGKSVARLRRRLGLSVTAFSRQLGVSAESVRRWEATAGRLRLQARPLAALATLHQQAHGK